MPPARDDPTTAPRKVAQEAFTYLRNHQQFMIYAEIPPPGPSITNSRMESAVKQTNRRVKATGKFWSEGAAESGCDCGPTTSAGPH